MNTQIVLPLSPKFLSLICFLPILLAAVASQAQQLPPQVIEQARRESLPAEKRAKHDNYQAAAKYWYASRNPKHLEDMDEALADLLPSATQLSSAIDNFHSWEEAQKYKPYHDAGAVLLAKAYTCLYYGDVKKAAPAVELIETKFPYAMLLQEDRGLQWVRENLRYHEHCCMLYAAMSLKVVGKIHFPHERDEFDGRQQRKALEHMAVLRLREGNVDRLEHFFTAINHSELQTSGGDWALDIIMNAMRPLDQDFQTEKAWREIHDAILIWQKQKPTSIFARLAEARFLYNYSMYEARHSATFALIRDASERGLGLMPDIPKTSPAWYDTMLRLQAVAGRPAHEIAPVFKQGLDKYPDYTPYAVALGRCFVNGGETGRQVCAEIIEQLQSTSKGALAAQMLRRIYFDGDLPAIQPRLNLDTVERCIRDAVARWPDSYELRSDLGILAVTIGRRALAADIMQGMSKKWCRYAWKGREDIAILLTSPDTAHPPRVDPTRKTTL
ncbi:hypothetical protein [Prosthecobacter vanneervenii]|uniref:DUF4034 domain-containing protein n=1 Tax=Prosthecobacter vanneervenii TaxID=48466 RepID=A0A7W7YDU2_9BACT|nr:hypothetical protein [Prosthecobacter vanneervenii]MBB5034197.1 hypothetical protein [Prosthecobacter vanneervenii]